MTWRDAYVETDEGDYEGEDYLVDTLGFLLPSTEYFINVAAELLPDGGYRGITHIPREIVKHTERLSTSSLQVVRTETM